MTNELRQRTAERDEALAQQSASTEVLQLINASPGALVPVFDAVLDKATRLCDFAFSILWTYDGKAFRAVAMHGVPQRYAQYLAGRTIVPPPGTEGAFWQFISGRDFVHIDDVATTPLAELTPRARGAVEMGGARTNMLVALRKDGRLLGAIEAYRTEVRPFSEKQVSLLQSFAAQAVIAMENARLIAETREALEQQTATAEVLQVINSSPGNLAPVFGAILEKAHNLCGATRGALQLYDGDKFRAVAVRGQSEAFADLLRQGYSPGPNNPERPLLEGARFAQVADLTEVDDPVARAAAELSGTRTALFIPLRKDGTLVGKITASRHEVKLFTEREITLLENFAAQAVIAMENARLITETREALEQQTATAEVLQVINASPGDLAPVFDAMLEKAMRLCQAAFGLMLTHDGTQFHRAAQRGVPAAYSEFHTKHPPTWGPGTGPARVLDEKRVIQVVDAMESDAYRSGEPSRRAIVDLAGARTLLSVPLLKDDIVRGILTVYRQEVRPFSDKQITLLQNFAAQAVIAMENARLLGELRERQAELRVTFDNMGDGVAMFDSDLRLTAWNSNFQQLLDLPDAFLAGRPTYVEYFRYLADRGEYSADVEARLSRAVEDLAPEMRFERTRPDGRVIEVRRNPVPAGGFVLIYSDITERKRAEEQVSAARDAAEAALRELQAAQASLLHAQKMAALGQLTAGIAHEIKNPLNFVNNFASLSGELLDELKEATVPATAALGAKKRTEIDETIEMLNGNLKKIIEHGRRADGIVKSMLAHSRGGSGDRQMVELNALVEESLNLAYHGARAQDQSFNITLERDFDATMKPIELVPQDVTRVFLNLFGNGFYAAHKRARGSVDGFRPVLRVATRDSGDAVEIRVRDNGTGIPADVRDKLFQPFFTTKPTGEGTGLGLSISYDIVTQQHGGSISVDSEEGVFTEFTVRLPRRPGLRPRQ